MDAEALTAALTELNFSPAAIHGDAGITKLFHGVGKGLLDRFNHGYVCDI